MEITFLFKCLSIVFSVLVKTCSGIDSVVVRVNNNDDVSSFISDSANDTVDGMFSTRGLKVIGGGHSTHSLNDMGFPVSKTFISM